MLHIVNLDETASTALGSAQRGPAPCGSRYRQNGASFASRRRLLLTAATQASIRCCSSPATKPIAKAFPIPVIILLYLFHVI